MQRTSREPRSASGGERGIALVAAVLMLLLTAVLAGTFMASTTSERAISGNVHVARAALVAADAGVRVAQQRLANVGFTKLDSSKTAWNGSDTLVVRNFNLNGFAGSSYSVTSTNPSFSATAQIQFVDTTVTANRTEQFFDYAYTITSTGGAGTFGQRMVQSKGILRLSVERGSFTDYLMFTNVHTTSSGAAVWFSSGTNFDGRVHTNGQFRFAFTPTFADRVSSVNSQAYFYNNNHAIQLASDHNGTVDVPVFGGGFTRGATSVPLPTNSYNQQGAALGLGGAAGALTNAQINTALGLGSGSSAPANGIYVPNSGGGTPAVTGGFYVQGTLDSLTMFVSGTNQIYRMRQGTTQTMITVDRVGNQTIFYKKVGSSSATIATYAGIPTNANVIYVNGSISNMGGTNRSGATIPPAIAEYNKLLVCATNDIIIQRDVMCENYTNNNNVLGVYSQAGSVRVGTNMPNDGRLDAYVMATGSSASFMVDNHDSGSPRGTFHLRGGMVTTYYGGFGTMNSSGVQQTGFLRDFHYDGRGLKPPFFPTTTTYNTNDPIARTLSWKEM